MLAEMGVRVWAPRPARADESPTATAPRAHGPDAAPVVAARPAVAAPISPPEVAPHVTSSPAVSPPVAETRAAEETQPRLHPGLVNTMDWPALREAVAGCQACALCKNRKNTVFGVGDTQADWMIVGEAPGDNEDRQGEPFVGAAGQLLDNMLRAVGRNRSGEGAKGTFIANVLKCRPPANRNPMPEEVAECEPYLVRQVALVQPKVIVAMGRFAVQSLLKTTEPIGRLRGKVHRYEGVPVIVTYHPAYLLRTPGDKGKAWADLCLAMDTLDHPPLP
ncbi:uracil-DNA glycosylase family protein [Hydrogenophaga sp.]|uniref:uracil-DNA glycosylase n=1 Tax=Hydrogenophaga sp. TaxID=1904254 RepID=UPI0027192338|nr:uracil-DNA glycosylase [Hydrogenophaga sp.]MDO9436078.1 uracil-DNA glycosylase [Hydrogenophaga sp.]